jgi:hypothetical protein
MTTLRHIARAVLVALTLMVAGQIDAAVILGFHETQVLVQHTPLFLEAAKRGQCPQLSDGILNGHVATFVIRGGCKRYSLVGDLYVDVRTGIITKDNGTPGGVAVETPELAELRRTLFAERANARLTRPNAICLLRRVADSLHPGRTCGGVTILSEDDNSFQGSVDDNESCATIPQRGQLTFAIDRYDGSITDVKSGAAYGKSADVEQLRTDLLAMHSPARLTVEDAKLLAAAYPATVGSAGNQCTKVEVDPLYTADEVWFQIWRGCGDDATVTRLSVIVLSGATRVIDSNASSTSPELQATREKILNEARARKSAAAEGVRKACAEKGLTE